MIGPYSEKGDTSEALAKGSTAADRGRAPGHRDRPRRRHCVGGHTNVPALNGGDSALTGSHRAAAQSTPSTDPCSLYDIDLECGDGSIRRCDCPIPFGSCWNDCCGGLRHRHPSVVGPWRERPQGRSEHREGRHFGDASCPVRRPGTLNGRPGRSAGHDRKQRQRLSHRPVERRREVLQGSLSFNASAGLTDTTPSPCVQCAGFPWPGWGLTKTVAMDQITLLRRMVQPNIAARPRANVPTCCP